MCNFFYFIICFFFAAFYLNADIIYIRAFDLGGGGLKTSVFSYNSQNQSMEWLEPMLQLGSCPEEKEVSEWLRYRMKELLGKDLDEEVKEGYLFGFSLAGLNKLRARPLATFDMAALCRLPADKVSCVDDGTSHLIASLHELKNQLPSGPIWNFALGTAVGVGYFDHNERACSLSDLYALLDVDVLWCSIQPGVDGPMWRVCGATYGFDQILAEHGELNERCFLEFAKRWKYHLDAHLPDISCAERFPKALIFTGGHIEKYGNHFVEILTKLGCSAPLFVGPTGAGLLGAAWNAIECDLSFVRWPKGDVNMCDALGYTALSMAIQAEQPDLVRLLIENGARINRQNFAGETPLIQAIQNNNYAIVQLLLEKGADMNIADRWERLPISFAKASGNVEIEDLLLYGE